MPTFDPVLPYENLTFLPPFILKIFRKSSDKNISFSVIIVAVYNQKFRQNNKNYETLSIFYWCIVYV